METLAIPREPLPATAPECDHPDAPHRWENRLNTSSSRERRGGPRISVDLPVRLELSNGGSKPGRMRNASISGALIECTLELPNYSPLRVEILAAVEGLAEPIQLAARVVRAEHPCIGVEWRELAPPEYLGLLRSIDLAVSRG
jgi:hypothetical protein